MLGDFQPDYIVVGAGSAGCVVADILSRNPNNKILIVEAGPSGRFNPWIKIPLGFGKTFGDKSINWCLETAIDKGTGFSQFWPRGKVWGGSSAINGLVWLRSFPSDIEGWREAASFGWDDLLPHYDAIEKRIPCETPEPFFALDDKRLHHAYFDAAKTLDIPLTDKFNFSQGAKPVVGYYHTNTQNGFRVGCREAFLSPALKRKNCRILSNFEARNLLIDQNHVRGVQGTNGTSLTATRDVILCGGTIGSAITMLRSGLKEHLPHLGENLSDHLGLNCSFKSTIPTTNNKLNNLLVRSISGLKYLLARQGPLAFGINPAGGFFKTNPKQKEPNFQLYLQSVTTVSQSFHPSNKHKRPILEPDPFPAFNIGLSNCRPKSTGSITLNANGSPHIQPNSFSQHDDMLEFIDAIKFVRSLAQTPHLAAIIEQELTPGASIQSDADIEADIRQRCSTVYHPVSTCRMGKSAADAVVDRSARVFGVSGLRVIDASIFPTQLSVNTNATVIALAHKLATNMIAESTAQ